MRPRLAAAATKWRIRALGLAWRGTLPRRRAVQQGWVATGTWCCERLLAVYVRVREGTLWWRHEVVWCGVVWWCGDSADRVAFCAGRKFGGLRRAVPYLERAVRSLRHC